MKKVTLIKTLVGTLVVGTCLVYLTIQAVQSSYAYYSSVDEFTVKSSEVKKNYSHRVAGIVKNGSIAKNMEKMSLSFIMSGAKSEVSVFYEGVVPDNFAEDMEVVVEGRSNETGVLEAKSLMTKCDSKYEAKEK